MKKFLLAVCLFLGATFYVKGAFVFSGGTVAQLLQTPPTVTSTNIYCTGVTADQDGYAGIFSNYPASGAATNEHDVFVWGPGRLIRTLASVLPAPGGTNGVTNLVVYGLGASSNALTVVNNNGDNVATLGSPSGTNPTHEFRGNVYINPNGSNTFGRLGIGTSTPSVSLEVNGNITATANTLGIKLNAANSPLITRGWDFFTNGPYLGIGRWGLFMESNALTLGIPNQANKSAAVYTYNIDSTLATRLFNIDRDNAAISLQGNTRYTEGISFGDGAVGEFRSNGTQGTPGDSLTIGSYSDMVFRSSPNVSISSQTERMRISASSGTVTIPGPLSLTTATIVSSNINLILPRATNVVGGVMTDVAGNGILTFVVPSSGGVAGSVVSSGLTPGVVPVASGTTNLSDGYFQLSGGFIVPLTNAANPFGSQTNAVKSVTIDGGNITVTTNYPQSFVRMKQNNASGSYTNRVSWIDDNLQSSLLTSFHDIWITKSRGIVASMDETGLFNAAGGVSSAGVGTFTGGVSAGGSLMSALAVSGALSSATFTLATTNLQTTLTSLQSQINNAPVSLINRVASTFNKTADTTPATVTGTSITLASSTKYIIKIFLLYSADATGGVAISTGGTATATDVGFAFNIKDVSTTALTALDSSLAVSHTLTGTLSGMATYEGAINVNAGGTFLITFAQSVANGTSSILRNSYISATVSPN